MAQQSSKQWASEHGKSSIHALATYQVTTAIPGPRTVYRATFDFGFELPTPDTTVIVDPAAAHLSGSFQPFDFPVPEPSIASNLIVTLDGAREVRRVAFTSGKYNGKQVQLSRIDQQKVAPEPTVSAPIGGSNFASAFGGFTDVSFVVSVQNASLVKDDILSITVRGAATGNRLGILDPDEPDSLTFFWPTPDDTDTNVNAGAAFAKALQDYLASKAGDLTPTARLVMQGDQPCTFLLTAFDTGAHFALDGFAFPALTATDLTDAEGLASRIQAAADPVSACLRNQIGSSALLVGLNAVISGTSIYDPQRFAGVTLGPATQAALAADDPHRLNRLLLQDAYPDAVAAPMDKRVLRFGKERVGEAAVAVQLPAGATISKATLSSQEGLLADRTGSPSPPAAAEGSRNGIHVGSDGTTAVIIEVDEAVSATGVALPLVAVAAGTEVTVELQEDFQGTPSGKKLAAGRAALAVPGAVERATVFFDPVVLAAGTAWIVLRAAKGEAVWLAAVSESERVRVRRTANGDSGVETALDGLAPLFELFSRSGAAIGAAATTLTVGTTVVAAQRDGDTSAYDLVAALAPLAAAGGTIPLTFTSSVAGTITVYPPHIEYDI